MDLFEYQARELFERHGVPVVRGIVVTSPDEARAAAESLAVSPVVVKAQVKTGGRGKAGGVKLARTPDEAAARARDILSLVIKGHQVRSVMVTEGVDIAEEYYVSLMLDRTDRAYLALCTREGGVDIEELAATRPEALSRIPVDPLVGIDPVKALEIVEAAGFDVTDRPEIARILQRLGQIYQESDATLVEVNPLVKTTDGRILAIDGKITLDDNASFRHPEWALFADPTGADPLEARARERHLNYVKLDGHVGIIGNGAGLVMSTLDVVAMAGADLPGSPRPANFLDIGGGASAKVMADGLDIILSDPQVSVVFVNVFGGITACSEVAKGIVDALQLLGDRATKPIVVRLDGNAVDVGRHILAEAAHPLVRVEPTMDSAALAAARLASAAIKE